MIIEQFDCEECGATFYLPCERLYATDENPDLFCPACKSTNVADSKLLTAKVWNGESEN